MSLSLHSTYLHHGTSAATNYPTYPIYHSFFYRTPLSFYSPPFVVSFRRATPTASITPFVTSSSILTIVFTKILTSGGKQQIYALVRFKESHSAALLTYLSRFSIRRLFDSRQNNHRSSSFILLILSVIHVHAYLP